MNLLENTFSEKRVTEQRTDKGTKGRRDRRTDGQRLLWSCFSQLKVSLLARPVSPDSHPVSSDPSRLMALVLNFKVRNSPANVRRDSRELFAKQITTNVWTQILAESAKRAALTQEDRTSVAVNRDTSPRPRTETAILFEVSATLMKIFVSMEVKVRTRERKKTRPSPGQ